MLCHVPTPLASNGHKSAFLTMRITAQEMDWLDSEAARLGVSRSQAVRVLLGRGGPAEQTTTPPPSVKASDGAGNQAAPSDDQRDGVHAKE